MKNFFKTLNEEKLAKICKYFFLSIALICTVLIAVELVVPFIEYEFIVGERRSLIPITAWALLQDADAVADGVAFLGVGVFTAVIVMVGVALLFFGKGVLSFFYSEKKLAKCAKTLVVLSVILTGVYYLGGIVTIAICRTGESGLYATPNGAPFVLSLIVSTLYSVAKAFLEKVNKGRSEEAKETEEEGEETSPKTTNWKAEWLRKGIFLALSLFSVIMLLVLLGLPFNYYKSIALTEYVTVCAKEIIAALREATYLPNNALYVGLSLVGMIIPAIPISLIFFAKSIVNCFTNEEKMIASVKASIVFSSIITGLYFVASIIVNAIFYMQSYDVVSANNIVPFILMLVADVAYAVMLGVYHKLYLDNKEEKEKDPEKKEKSRKRRGKLYRARLELFICTIIIIGLSIASLLTNIVTVTFEEIFTIQIPSIELSGLDLLRNYLTIDAGAQTLTFIIMLLLSLAGAAFFLTLISFVSKSNTFYRLSLVALCICTISTFLVGMFGQYYQVVQKLNEGMLSEHLSTKVLETLEAFNLDLALNYTVASSSFYFFIGAFVVIAYLLIRNPYTKGINIEKELALQQASENPHTIQGEISLKEIPEELTKRNDGTVVSIDKNTGEEKVMFADPCSIFTELDEKIPQFNAELEEKRRALFEDPTLPKLTQFIVQYARDSRLHLSYTEEDIATFVAGLGATKLTILQGMSGTGKTSLPKIFAEALCARCEIVEVESSWRDKNELLGYYNEFSKNYTPKKFTQALYRAKLNPDTLTFIVLDEMNLSRIEYYFSDFLSLMENEPDQRELRLVNVSLARTENGEKVPYAGLFEGHTMKIPGNVWFIGTANRDESTFEISDKVYDRAHTMNFNKRAAKVLYFNDPIPKRFLPVDMLEKMFAEAKASVKFNIDTYPIIAQVEKLLAPYNISFGNRIAIQIENFVNVYCSCFAASEEVIHTAVERILLSKVVSKLELKSVENKELLAAEFEKLNLQSCCEFILKLNED